MAFLAMVLALLARQAWGPGNRLQRDGWFERYRGRLQARRLAAGWQLLLLVVLPALLVGWLLATITPLAFGLLWIAAAAVLLVYSFGRSDLKALQQRYAGQCRRGDFEGAWLRASAELDRGAASESPADPLQAHAGVQRSLLYAGYQQWFAVLLYFFMLGPAVALAYRLLQLWAARQPAPLARRCLAVADWLPARVLAATFSLAGDFVGSSDEFLAAALDVKGDAADMLFLVAAAAAGPAPGDDSDIAAFGEAAASQSEAFAGLLRRSAVAWVVVISILVVMF